MRTITKIFHTETGHRLTDYAGACAHFHGHSYKWEVTVTSKELDKTGFIMDYKDLKTVLEKTIDAIDHGFLLHSQDPILANLTPKELKRFLKATNGQEANLHILPFNPTTENILHWVKTDIMKELPEGVSLVKIRVYETASSFAEWINEKE